MDNVITYLNADLDLTSAHDLTELVGAFEGSGLWTLQATLGDDGLWYAAFETQDHFREPEPNIAAILDIVESLTTPIRTVWDSCTRRELNVGYDCGAEPWAFNQGLSANILGLLAAAGASLRLTLYPDKSDIETTP